MADNSITTELAVRIAELGPSVVGDVVEHLVERETKKRVDALVIVHDKLCKMESDFRKLGPDQKTFDEEGKELSAVYSGARSKERKELKEKITKLTGAINKALDEKKKDFSDVYNLAQSSSKDGGGKGQAASDTGSTTEGD